MARQCDERRSVGAVHLRGPTETFLLLFLVGTRRERAWRGRWMGEATETGAQTLAGVDSQEVVHC
jgi:hypothetical protein